MKIVQFADADEISPIFFEKPYQIVAQPGGERALELLRQAMLAENKVAIGTTVLGNSETPVAIMPYGDDLVMITLHYASEVKDIPKTVQHPEVAEPELDMAKRLIDSMTEPFDPARFRNAYQEKLMDLIQSKIAGKAVVTERPAERPNNIIDLMDALSASLKEQEDGSEGTAKAPARKRTATRSSASRAPRPSRTRLPNRTRRPKRTRPASRTRRPRRRTLRGRRRKARSQAQPQARLVTPAPGERTAGSAEARGPARARRPVR